MPEPIPLSALQPGQIATVARISGRAQARRRFLEMGFVRGASVRVERVAPLGDPVEYQVKGTHLSLRRADAANIFVYYPLSQDE